MGKWAHFDTDEERLPDGMVRTGYDADTQQYTYRDRRGVTYEGAPGCRYGPLVPTNARPTPSPAAVVPTAAEPSPATRTSVPTNTRRPRPTRDRIRQVTATVDARNLTPDSPLLRTSLHGKVAIRSDGGTSSHDGSAPPPYSPPLSREKQLTRELPSTRPTSGVRAVSKQKEITPDTTPDTSGGEKRDEHVGEWSTDDRYEAATASLEQARRQARAREFKQAQETTLATLSSLSDRAGKALGSLQRGAQSRGRDLQRRASVWVASGRKETRESQRRPRRASADTVL